jgi:hypothetical protein
MDIVYISLRIRVVSVLRGGVACWLEQWWIQDFIQGVGTIRRRVDDGRSDEGTPIVAIREVGFRVGELITGDWRAIGESKSSSRRVSTRNRASAWQSGSPNHKFYF